MGKGGWIGGRRIGAMCPILSSLAYKSFKGMGSGGNCSKYILYMTFGGCIGCLASDLFDWC
jgi:hypothetical protein